MVAKKKVVILHERDNPSTEFFIMPKFSDSKCYETYYISSSDEICKTLLKDAIVVVVRYLTRKRYTALKKNLAEIETLIYFMDDDLWDLKVTKGLPWRYRLKIVRYALKYKSWLIKNCELFWTSSDFIVQKYKPCGFKMISPKPVSIRPVHRVFYHGSASHQAEFEWLVPVIQTLQEKRDDVVFEVIGGRETRQLFASISCVNVIHPMNWESYKAYLSLGSGAIGLAPATANMFNFSRSYTKFFDITAANAVGIYAVDSASGRFAKNGIDGLCLPMNIDDWVGAIDRLLDNHEYRKELLCNAKQRVKALLNEGYSEG
jgi:glycosyltransferase involved in cell wall biosynthesis